MSGMSGWNILMVFYNPSKFLQGIYDTTGVHKPLAVYNLFAFIGVALGLVFNFDFMPIKCLCITFALYVFILLIVNIISKARLESYEVINILLNSLIYYNIGLLLLINFIGYTQYIIILFGVFSLFSYIVFISTLSYFCSYKNTFTVIAFIIIGLMVNIFNIAAGVKAYCNVNNIDVSKVSYELRGFYYLKSSEDLAEDYRKIFGDGEYRYSGIDENGNLLKTLPSTDENIQQESGDVK